MKADSRTSSHFWRQRDASALQNIHIEKGPPVKMQNATVLNNDQVGEVPLLQHLSKIATKARILQGL